MKVGDICTKSPRVVTIDATLAEAAKVMWEGDCGVLPVVDKTRKVVGVVTDRDICLAVAAKKTPVDTKLSDLIKPRVISCRADEDVKTVLARMASNQIRRLPVVSAEGKIEGLFSLHDAISHSDRYRDGRAPELDGPELIKVLQSIGESPDVKSTLKLPQTRK